MLLSWELNAWADYVSLQAEDRRTLKRVNLVLQDIIRHLFTGLRQTRTAKRQFRRVMEPPHRRQESLDILNARLRYSYYLVQGALYRQINKRGVYAPLFFALRFGRGRGIIKGVDRRLVCKVLL